MNKAYKQSKVYQLKVVLRDISPMIWRRSQKIFQADIQAIQQTLDLLDEGAFGSARRTKVYSIGASAPIALDAYYRLLRIGLRVSVVTDSHMQAVSASLLKRRGAGGIAPWAEPQKP